MEESKPLSKVVDANLPQLPEHEKVRQRLKSYCIELNSAIVECLEDASLKAELSEVGQDIYPRDQHSADFLRTLQLSDIEKWTPIIKSANINILEN